MITTCSVNTYRILSHLTPIYYQTLNTLKPLNNLSTSPNKILFLIKKLKDVKSPGYDLITNKVLKNLPRKPILLITFIFNAMLRFSYFLLIFKLSTVILVPKPKKPKTSHLVQADKFTPNSS